MKDNYGTKHQLLQFDPRFGSETLGVIIAPDGNNCDRITGLNKKNRSREDKIKTVNITNNVTQLDLKYTIIKTLSYPLSDITLTEVECEKILSTIVIIFLKYTGTW